MKKFYLLSKTLLVAVCLMVGTSNAWGDKVLYSQDYQSATDASSWTSSDGTATPVSLQTASTNKFIRVGTSTNGRYAYTNFFENNTSATSTFYKSYTSYTLSFDALLLGSSRQPSELVVMANGHSMPGSVNKRYRMVNAKDYVEGTNKYLLFLQSTDVGDNGSADAAVYQKFYINQTSTTVTLPKDAWCTYTLNVTPTKVYYTIINKSTSATLQSGEYDIPDGQSNLAQGIFTFLHKQGTSGAGSGGQGGCLDIDNISIRIEPISASLDHTAGAQWGSNTGASTVDANQEHYNNDASSGWAGCAYAKFSYSIPAGYTIKSAILTYSVNQGGSYGRDDIIYYMAKDFDIDWANFAGQTGTDLRNTGSRAGKAVAAAPTGGTGDRLNLSQDVTSSVQAIHDAGQDYIIFQWTGNAGGGDLYGKGADAAKQPKLVIETAPAVLVAIEDCEAHETSAAFATAVEAASFANVSEVYAFHTNWQIENAGSNDITKVIFDAQVSDFTRWNNARNNSGQQYSGAPDSKYFDAWNNDPSDGKQKIYGLPAGTYTIKVATRASADITDKSKYNVWVSGGSADVSVLGSHIGGDGGSLGNGWNWTILSFTLDAKADVEVGFYSCPPTDRWAGCDDFHLYKGTLNVSGTITPAGWASFSSTLPLDLSTITGGAAYYASASGGETVTLTPTTAKVPANTGLMIKGEPNAPFTIATTSAETTDLSASNLLKGQITTGNVAASTDAIKHYVFGYKTSDPTEYGFYNLASATSVEAGKAYLEINSAVVTARALRISLGGITEVENIEAEPEAKAQEGKFIEKRCRR